MAEIIKTTFQLRRGYEAVWERNNPILASGEPGYVIDKNALKIGNGVTPWNELEYVNSDNGQGGVYNAQTHLEFPSIGSVNMIYKAQAEKKIYQWNPDNLTYEALNEVEISIQDLELINGGNAYGTA